MTGKFSATITAAALVKRAAAAYFGLATKVISPDPACSMPLRPVISVSGEPFWSRALRAEAIRESFMVGGWTRVNRTPAPNDPSTDVNFVITGYPPSPLILRNHRVRHVLARKIRGTKELEVII